MSAGLPPEEIIEPELRICDPHHHLWDGANGTYLLPQLLADIGRHRVESTVYLQARSFYDAFAPPPLRCVGETAFANGVAAMADSGTYGPARVCAGIVSYADLTLGAEVAPVLEAHIRAGGDRFRGIRQSCAWDPSPEVRDACPVEGLYGRASFREGFARLAGYGLSFDAWLYHPQIPELTSLARAFPQTQIVLDHVGGPVGIGPYAGRREEVFRQWAADIREAASCPNIWIKLGGLGMQSAGFGFPAGGASSTQLAQAWRPYLETCIEAFGVRRAMFESNFPPDRLSGTYDATWNAFKRVAAGASAAEKASLFRDSAMAFYRLAL